MKQEDGEETGRGEMEEVKGVREGRERKRRRSWRKGEREILKC